MSLPDIPWLPGNSLIILIWGGSPTVADQLPLKQDAIQTVRQQYIAAQGNIPTYLLLDGS